jgi:hypothetical protein
MRSKADLKEEWLRCSGLNHSAEDIWLRDKVASLFDLAKPNEEQDHLLWMADKRLTLLDLPSGAWPGHKEELMALAQKMFGPPGGLDKNKR